VEGGKTHMVYTVRFGRHEVYITDKKKIAQYWNVPSPKI